MVQSACLREFDHSALFWSLHWSRNRAVLRQRPMWTRVVIVFEVVLENVLKVAFADDDEVIEALAADGPDESFDVRILPRRTRRNGLLLEPKGRHAFGELLAVGTITVAQQVLRRSFEREGVYDLLPGPSCRRSLGDGEMQHLPAVVGQNREDKENTESDRRHREDVDRDELFRVVGEEGPPRLRRWSALTLRPALSDCRGGNLKPEVREFRVNPGTAPSGIGLPHAANQIDQLAVLRCSAQLVA